MVKISAADTNPSGGKYATKGRFHFVVERCDVRYSNNGNEQLVYDWRVLAGSPRGNEGRTHREYFSLDGAAAGPLWMFLVAVGLKTVADWEAARNSGQGVEVDEQAAVGCQFCAELRDEEYQSKFRTKAGFRIWPVGAPEASDIPKDQESLNLLKGVARTGQPATAGAPSGGGKSWDGF